MQDAGCRGQGIVRRIPALCIPYPQSFKTMPTQIKLPNLGENIESGDVLSIFVSEGDTVKADQDLLEVETDKATMPVPAPQGGKITKILIKEGETVEVGAPIMEIEAATGAPSATPQPKPAALRQKRRRRSRKRSIRKKWKSDRRGRHCRRRRRAERAGVAKSTGKKAASTPT